MTSQGLLQTITPTFHDHDPLANMQAAVDYASHVYSRPRRGGKQIEADTIRAAMMASAWITREQMDAALEDLDASRHPSYADGGILPGPAPDYIPTTLRPGEYVLTPEMTRAIAGDIVLQPIDVAAIARVDEALASQIVPPPPDDDDEIDLPEPPAPAVF